MNRMRLVAAIALASVPLVAAAPPTDLSSLAWMEGRWTGSKDGVHMEEHWTAPTGGALIGMHKDVKDGRVVSFEFMRIVDTPKDGILYFASPRGVPPTPFRLVEQAERRVVFENKEHDFPQRILYWREADVLHARIEGRSGGKALAEDWSWKKS